MTPKRVALLVVFFLFAIFVVQNVELMEVRFLFWRTGASRALVLVSTFGLGLLAGWLVLWLRKPERRGGEALRGSAAPDTGGEQRGAVEPLAEQARRPEAAGSGEAAPKG
ncbi:MAG TPA: LapA family protein [Syntrophobacteria bacterium]|nr:LapA family protein [Syntrophobacteria bacterium]